MKISRYLSIALLICLGFAFATADAQENLAQEVSAIFESTQSQQSVLPVASRDTAHRRYSVDSDIIQHLAVSRVNKWDGRNRLGEPVASGVYLYTLTAGEFTATRKMLIRK